MVLEQWEDMKEQIRSTTLVQLKYHDLWARMLTMYTDEFALILRLVVIALLVPADTSECERVFSLMNDLKTAERNKLSSLSLSNLMTWHFLAKDLKPEQLPVMSILKEFRNMAGERGRQSHKPSQPPVYDYQLASKQRDAALGSSSSHHNPCH